MLIILALKMIGMNFNECHIDKNSCRDLENYVKQLNESILSLSMRIRGKKILHFWGT